jgi:hypothetical protein
VCAHKHLLHNLICDYSLSIAMNKEHILAEIKRTAVLNGGVALGKDRFFQETGIKSSDWIGKLWARWGDAVKEAGLLLVLFRGVMKM